MLKSIERFHFSTLVNKRQEINSLRRCSPLKTHIGAKKGKKEKMFSHKLKQIILLDLLRVVPCKFSPRLEIQMHLNIFVPHRGFGNKSQFKNSVHNFVNTVTAIGQNHNALNEPPASLSPFFQKNNFCDYSSPVFSSCDLSRLCHYKLAGSSIKHHQTTIPEKNSFESDQYSNINVLQTATGFF